MQQRGRKSLPRGEGCCSSVPVALDLLVVKNTLAHVMMMMKDGPLILTVR